MHAITGGFSVLPEIPWSTESGTSFTELQARADALQYRLEAAIDNRGLRDLVPVTLLAAEMAELCAELRALKRSEVLVDKLIGHGRALERAERRSRRMRLLLPPLTGRGRQPRQPGPPAAGRRTPQTPSRPGRARRRSPAVPVPGRPP